MTAARLYPALPARLAEFMFAAGVERELVVSVPTTIWAHTETFCIGKTGSAAALAELAELCGLGLLSVTRFSAVICDPDAAQLPVTLDCARVPVSVGVAALADVAIDWDEHLTAGRPLTGGAAADRMQAIVTTIDEIDCRAPGGGLQDMLTVARRLDSAGRSTWRASRNESTGLMLAEALWYEARMRINDGPFGSAATYRPDVDLLAALLAPHCGTDDMLVPADRDDTHRSRRGVAQAAALVDHLGLVAVARAEQRLAQRTVTRTRGGAGRGRSAS